MQPKGLQDNQKGWLPPISEPPLLEPNEACFPWSITPLRQHQLHQTQVTGWSHGFYFKKAPSSPAEVASTLVTLSGVGHTKGVGWDEAMWADSMPMERQGPGCPWGWGASLPMVTEGQAALEKEKAQEQQGMLICC